ncbi:hypothetical protein V1387_10405 [Allomuricauda taeanensis]|uniref:hypothetical protein n=1 Tax=Flagellimonas taeanensis TaxID=1005926 RepID=UPI002E7BE762|nr:hypothetical protein [Allomuricauda taeanensis]MEE1963095.1 hypothetical protein [Allomuricauda taeanensis]
MKKSQTTWAKIIPLVLFGFMLNHVMMAQSDSMDNNKKREQQLLEKTSDFSQKDNDKSQSGNKENADKNNVYPIITEFTIQVITVGFFLIMILLIVLFFVSKVKSSNPYFGFHSIKFIGMILMFPGICILALISTDLISGSTLAALFGTIAGYVLSRDKDDDSDSSGKSNLKKQNKELLEKISKLETEIEALEKGNT